jgi:hypothetical protein
MRNKELKNQTNNRGREHFHLQMRVLQEGDVRIHNLEIFTTIQKIKPIKISDDKK